MQKLLKKKYFKKNPVKCQLLPNFMVNDSNFHQTWPPLLLKIENFDEKINTKILKNSVKCQWLANFGFG
jgi:hypothetical protein